MVVIQQNAHTGPLYRRNNLLHRDTKIFVPEQKKSHDVGGRKKRFSTLNFHFNEFGEKFVLHNCKASTNISSIVQRVGVYSRDGKEPSLLEFGSVRVRSVRVLHDYGFGSVRVLRLLLAVQF